MGGGRRIVMRAAGIGLVALMAAGEAHACEALLGAGVCAGEVGRAWAALAAQEARTPGPDRARFDASLKACLARAVNADRCAADRLWVRLQTLSDAERRGDHTGRWVGDLGAVEIVEGGDGLAAVRIETQTGRHGYRCRIVQPRAWRSNQSLAWAGEIVAGQPDSACSFTLRRTGDRLIVDGLQLCAWACGARGEYRGAYRRTR